MFAISQQKFLLLPFKTQLNVQLAASFQFEALRVTKKLKMLNYFLCGNSWIKIEVSEKVSLDPPVHKGTTILTSFF